MTRGGVARQFGRPGATFYDGTEGRTLTTCPDCRENADALFGDHGGFCITESTFAAPNSAHGVVRVLALRHEVVTGQQLREAFAAAGVQRERRDIGLAAALHRGWLEVLPSGRTVSYRSTIFVPPARGGGR